MHSTYVWNMIKQGKPLRTRYDRTHIYDRYYIRTHVYVCLFSVEKRVFEESRTLWLWMSGKRKVSVCRGHELANALYFAVRYN